MENEKLEPIGTISINQKRLKDCEWCFQFDEDDAQVFAWTDEEMTEETPKVAFTIDNIEGAYVSFTNKVSGKIFKLFARELSEEGLKLREYQKSESQSMKDVIKNFDKNMEYYASDLPNKETEA
jgi:hypothetical protein